MLWQTSRAENFQHLLALTGLSIFKPTKKLYVLDGVKEKQVSLGTSLNKSRQEKQV